jgi:hypothetical protein
VGRKTQWEMLEVALTYRFYHRGNDDESLCLSFKTLKPVEPAGNPGRVNRGRFWGPLSPPCETPGCVSLLWPLHTALQFVSSYGEPNLNLFLVQVKSSGPISRTPCACMEHVIIPNFFYSFAQIWTIFALFLIADDVEILAV